MFSKIRRMLFPSKALTPKDTEIPPMTDEDIQDLVDLLTIRSDIHEIINCSPGRF